MTPLFDDVRNMLRQHDLESRIWDDGKSPRIKIEFESTAGNPCTLIIARQPGGQYAINRARLKRYLRRAIDDRP